MKDGPSISHVAALIGDPARANILTALMSGKALTASELSIEAGVSVQTTSSHLSRLSEGELIRMRKSGRHRYFTLASEDVAAVLEALMGLAATQGRLRTRTGPKDPALREARICYSHLAGRRGIQMMRSLLARDMIISGDGDHLSLTPHGEQFLQGIGVEFPIAPQSRAPLCRACLDWSERASHLAGKLGRALLDHLLANGHARREEKGRVISFTPNGVRYFDTVFPVDT